MRRSPSYLASLSVLVALLSNALSSSDAEAQELAASSSIGGSAPVRRSLASQGAFLGLFEPTPSDTPALWRGAQTPYGGDTYQAPPPPQQPEGSGFELPEFSIRVDPFNWLLEGRLGLELEAELYDFITVELVPVFVANEQPPALNLGGVPDTLYQQSDGLGAMSGASLGLGFWLEGDPFEGTVIRAIITNYAYTYEAEDDAGLIDSLDHTERHLYGMLGSHARWKAFTIAGGIGLGVELNKQSRCADGLEDSQCDDSELLLRTDRDNGYANLNSSLYPAVLHGRISLGVVF